MSRLAVALCAAALAALAAEAAPARFMVVAPSHVRAGERAGIAVAPALGTLGAVEAVETRILLRLYTDTDDGEGDDAPTPSAAWEVTWVGGSAPDLRSLEFPANLPAGNFELIATAPGADDVHATITVLEPASPIVLIEIDKPVYKPGQSVRIRALAMDAALVPVGAGEEIHVTVSNPDGVIIARWVRNADLAGAVEIVLPTAAEPALGTYTVDVEVRVDRGRARRLGYGCACASLTLQARVAPAITRAHIGSRVRFVGVSQILCGRVRAAQI